MHRGREREGANENGEQEVGRKEGKRGGGGNLSGKT